MIYALKKILTTIKKLNDDLKSKINFKISLNNCEDLDEYSISLIAEYLEISLSKLIKNNSTPIFLFKTKSEIDKSKRPIIKGGIHFYNYYTLPTPRGFVSPVLLDVMCPKEVDPTLNNGHLEPAITISMGPNDIYAKFSKKINKDTFFKFKINKDPKTDWIIGDSYFEPSFCKHTYSRATDKLGRIISYTTKSNIENLLMEKLNNDSTKNFIKANKNKKTNRTLLKLEIETKGYSLKDISKKLNYHIKNYLVTLTIKHH